MIVVSNVFHEQVSRRSEVALQGESRLKGRVPSRVARKPSHREHTDDLPSVRNSMRPRKLYVWLVTRAGNPARTTRKAEAEGCGEIETKRDRQLSLEGDYDIRCA
jgi:hypothetical protein